MNLCRRSIALDDVRHYLRLNHCTYSRRLNFRQRSRIFIEHNHLISRSLGGNFLHPSQQSTLTLWHEKFDTHILTIKLSTPKGLHRYEGEMILTLECDEINLITMSFQTCNGEHLSETGKVVFVTRIQGAPNHYNNVKKACKLMSNMNLSFALISALEGFCDSLNIEKIIGIDCSAQTAFLGSMGSPNFINTYDKFWLKNHASLMSNGYYLLNLPLLPTYLPTPTGSHRARTLKHREIRRRITSATRQSLDDFKVSQGLNN